MSHSRLLRPLLALFVLAASLLLPSATPAPASAGDFVTVQGTQLIYRGKPIKLKGTNFYPKDQPWADMWKRWKGEAARGDLARAREVGIRVNSNENVTKGAVKKTVHSNENVTEPGLPPFST